MLWRLLIPQAYTGVNSDITDIIDITDHKSVIDITVDSDPRLWDKRVVDDAMEEQPMSFAQEMHDKVTAQIVAQLEAGTAPWVKPWKTSNRYGGSAMPHNAGTKRPYNGINVLILWMEQAEKNYPTAGWLTANQAKALGGIPARGEKHTKVVFYKPIFIKEKQEDGTIVEKKILMMKGFQVFNIAQCVNLPEKFVPVAEDITDEVETDDQNFAGWLKATGAKIGHGGDQAYYRPSTDSIQLPKASKFDTPSHYKATAFHELGHWTAAKGRCDRDLKGRFGDASYAAEELIAELCAAFMCAEMAVDGQLRHADYIGHWIKMLKDDPSAIFTAASQAGRAADFLQGRKRPAEATEEMKEAA